MPERKRPIQQNVSLSKDPAYRLHRQSGQAIVTLRDHLGRRRDHLLGPYDSESSKEEYRRLLTAWRGNGRQMPAAAAVHPSLSIAELILRYMQEYAMKYYVDPITHAPTSELEVLKLAFRPLHRLYATTPAAEFGPLALRAVRAAMASGDWMTDEEKMKAAKAKSHLGLSRGTINRHVDRIRRLFRWAAGHELVPAAVLHALLAVEGLRRGRSDARERPPVTPIAPEVVEATLPHLPPVVADMVQVQLYTGTRAGEVIGMRGVDIDMSGPIWRYRPQQHKTAWLGHKRVICIGPKAQSIIRNYLKPQVDAFLFSPREQDLIIKAKLRTKRKTQVQPSQVDRSKRNALRKPGEQFDVRAYNRAIARGCRKAGIAPWHSHQLRHTAALLIEREFGLEAARATLGQKCVQMTAHYAGIDEKRAAEVASRIG